MARKQTRYSPEFKTQVVLDLIATGKSLAEASRELSIRDSLLSRWRAEFLERAHRAFEPGASRDSSREKIAELERLIGQQTVEIEMLKKASSLVYNRRTPNAKS